jgi:pimeloyl-ACP methyl ester carboxylesterase
MPASLARQLGLSDGFVRNGDINLHYVERGSGALLLFLHGFPEFWYSWRHQLAEFGRDHRAVALDLRGYNDSDKPSARRAYQIKHLIADVAAAIDQLGEKPAILIGHDWGGAIAWLFAQHHPALLSRLVIINAPHPARFFDEIRHRRQWHKSRYMFLFQLPFVPERQMTRDGAAALMPLYRRHATNPDAFSDQDVQIFRQAFLKPGVARAAINYYRKPLAFYRVARQAGPIEVPTLLIWGDRDPYLGVRLSEGTDGYVRDLTVRHFPNAGHFVHEERAAEVNAEIRAFLAAPAPDASSPHGESGSYPA